MSLLFFLFTCGFSALLGYSSYKARGGRSGVHGLGVVAIAAYYAAGAIDREKPVYSVNLDATSFAIIGLGVLLMSIVVFLLSRPTAGPLPKMRDRTQKGEDRASKAFLKLGWVVMTCAGVNYFTGVIPALESDINAARLSADDYGLLGRLWPIILSALQLNVVLAWIWRAGDRMIAWRIVGVLSLVLLLLQASRSLLMFPLLVVAMCFLHRRRLAGFRVIALSVVGIVVLGAFGSARSSQSTGEDVSTVQSLDESAQVGPRVMQLARDQLVAGRPLDGSILFGDFGNQFDSSVQRSDRVVTELIGRDPDLIGGSPPTLFGGAYLEFGFVGIVILAVAVGLVLSWSASRAHASGSAGRLILHGWLTAYVVLATYSYVSLKPALVYAIIACFVMWRKEEANADSDRLEVPTVHRWR